MDHTHYAACFMPLFEILIYQAKMENLVWNIFATHIFPIVRAGLTKSALPFRRIWLAREILM